MLGWINQPIFFWIYSDLFSSICFCIGFSGGHSWGTISWLTYFRVSRTSRNPSRAQPIWHLSMTSSHMRWTRHSSLTRLPSRYTMMRRIPSENSVNISMKTTGEDSSSMMISSSSRTGGSMMLMFSDLRFPKTHSSYSPSMMPQEKISVYSSSEPSDSEMPIPRQSSMSSVHSHTSSRCTSNTCECMLQSPISRRIWIRRWMKKSANTICL